MTYRPALHAEDLPAGKPTPVTVEGEALCLVRLDDCVVAFPDRCPHRGYPLSHGSLDGTVLTCAAHTWQFDVRTGDLVRLRAPDRLELRDVRERDGVIEVDT
jgi:toluene monooxygenase system ferredoxin subunit